MSAARSPVTCPPVLDLAYAVELREALLHAIGEGGDVEVNAAEVGQADTACLQVLCAAAATLGRGGRSLIISHPSAALTRVAERLGLSKALGLDGHAFPPAGPGPRDADKGT